MTPSIAPGFPIAIVGIGCRYADARGPAEFWQIVRSGRNTVRDVPQHRIELGYDIDHFYDPRPRIPGKISSKKGGFLEHPELFDAAAYGIAPRDALTMEPQQRLMVEVTWDALEDAGIVPESLAGERVAVILGYMAEDYSRERLGVLGEESVFRGYDVFTVGGMSHAVLSGKVAYLLGVTGPSFTLDTACSSSLIATHLACESLQRGESKLAIAGGVNVFLAPEGNIALSRSGMLSMSGACKAFDASADGFVRAEGAGVVVLQPLSDALAAGNPVYAVIRGTGISSDGRDGGHMMAPGRKGQAQAIRDAYARAGVSPADVQYVETHGTGTLIGDPVEIGALSDVMGPGRPADRPLRVASVKGNLGHTESASGVAGLIKAALMLKKRELVAQLHFETPNPAIPWDEIPVRVQTETTPWPYPGPALIGVNSFGISGTNAHVVLESAPDPAPSTEAASHAGRPRLLPITAHDANALYEMAQRQREHLDELRESDFADLAYTLARRRSHRSQRLAIVASSLREAALELDAHCAGRPSAALRSGSAPADRAPRVVMVFPGQGGQWLGMGRELLESEPGFAASIDRLDRAFRSHVDWSLRAALDGSTDFDWTRRLDVLQPLLVAFEIALAELWMSRGVVPCRVIGQSMGEIAAAFVAGCLDTADVALIACHRGRLVAQVAGRGAMAVVSLPGDRVRAELASFPGVEVAGTSAPDTTLVSGDAEAVKALVAELDARSVFARQLEVDFASHCAHMDPLIEPFRECLLGFEPKPARIPLDSTVDACEKGGTELDVEYWLRNLREPVAFEAALSHTIEAGGEIFLEVSPHPTLGRAIDTIASARGHNAVYVSTLQREQDEARSIVSSLAELFVRGVAIDFEALEPAGRVIETPLYALQRKRFWFSGRNRSHRFRPVHPLLGESSQSSLDARLHSWDFVLDEDSGSFATGQRRATTVFAPSALLIELALACADAIWPDAPIELRHVDWRRELSLGVTGRRQLQVVLRVDGERRGELRLASRAHASDHWTTHASCTLQPASARDGQPSTSGFERRDDANLSVDRHFGALERCGIQVEAKCRTLRELGVQTNADARVLLAHLMLPRAVESEWHAHFAHPSLVETALQLVGTHAEPAVAVRPLSVERVTLSGGLGSECWCRITQRDCGAVSGISVADLEFFDRKQQLLGRVEGLRVEALPALAKSAAPSDHYRLEWVDARPEATASVSHWIVVSDSPEEAAILASELHKEGSSGYFCERVEELPALVDRLRFETGNRFGLALLAWGSTSSPGSAEPPTHRSFRMASWAEAIREHCSDAAQVWIATRGLVAVELADRPDALAARLLASEVESFTNCAEMAPCRLFDASRELHHAERLSLARWMGRAEAHRQFAARGERVMVPRLMRHEDGNPAMTTARALLAGDRNFRASCESHRDIGHITWLPALDALPGSDCVVVDVHTGALTQLDVMNGLSLSRGVGANRDVGFEFSGVVTQTGDGRQPFAIGERVFGVRTGALQRRLVVPVTQLARVPEGRDLREAASLPLAFLGAYYALCEVARVQPGERVLIGSAGGGVGQALVQLARSLGAQVSATASSPARREALRALGVESLFVAPTGDAFPKDAAYDVIVAAESGSGLHALLARLAPGGRYIDLCPRESFECAELGALRLGANRSLASVDIASLVRSEPQLVASLLARIADDLAFGRIAPIAATHFPAAQADRALRFMTQNRHVGRVCIDFSDAARLPLQGPAGGVNPAAACAVVIRGNRPALQSALARWLIEREVDVVASDADRRAESARIAFDAASDGWLQISAQYESGSETRRVEVLVSLREAVGSGDPSGRAWETRAWLDRLRLWGISDAAHRLPLSVASETPPDRVAEFIGTQLLRGDRAAPLFLLDASELAWRLRESPSPLLDGLKSHVVSTPLARNQLMAMAPPERRGAMQAWVVEALAGVLGLSAEQRDAIEPESRLDSLGLDSLMTLELFVGLGRELELELQADWFGEAPTLVEIAGVLLERLEEAGQRP